MEHIEEMFEQFAEKHPVWFWLLVRLAICFCLMFVVITALLALLAVLAPIFGAMIGLGAGSILDCGMLGFWLVRCMAVQKLCFI